MKRNKAKQATYQKKYMNRHKMLSVLLDEESDRDIISWLEKQENRSEAVRKAIRREMVEQKFQTCGECECWKEDKHYKRCGLCQVSGYNMSADAKCTLPNFKQIKR